MTFGGYFEGRDASDAFGAAYEGIYRLPPDATGIRPKGLYRFFAWTIRCGNVRPTAASACCSTACSST